MTDSLDDLVAIIQWMRDTEGKSWQQIAIALGERPAFIIRTYRQENLGTYKRIRRLRARARRYANRKLESLPHIGR